MKKLALLLSVLPAFAATAQPSEPSDQDRLLLRQASEARAYCEANNDGPSTARYGNCVNRYLQGHYGWQVVPRSDGGLGVKASPFR